MKEAGFANPQLPLKNQFTNQSSSMHCQFNAEPVNLMMGLQNSSADRLAEPVNHRRENPAINDGFAKPDINDGFLQVQFLLPDPTRHLHRKASNLDDSR